jgi:hypothetical protein
MFQQVMSQQVMSQQVMFPQLMFLQVMSQQVMSQQVMFPQSKRPSMTLIEASTLIEQLIFRSPWTVIIPSLIRASASAWVLMMVVILVAPWGGQTSLTNHLPS